MKAYKIQKPEAAKSVNHNAYCRYILRRNESIWFVSIVYSFYPSDLVGRKKDISLEKSKVSENIVQYCSVCLKKSEGRGVVRNSVGGWTLTKNYSTKKVKIFEKFI